MNFQKNLPYLWLLVLLASVACFANAENEGGLNQYHRELPALLGESCTVRFEVDNDGNAEYIETGNGNDKCSNSNGDDLTCVPNGE
jgi:hypothetical protein